MESINLSVKNEIPVITFRRGKVNAINEKLVDDLTEMLQKIESNDGVKSVILTGEGSFFSFGFDIPEFMDYSKDSFIRYLKKFTALYDRIFLFPKPVIAALNGHAIAGGCMIATACDYRIISGGNAKISLNEITFGSAVFAGATEILKCCTGQRNAELILTGGGMFSADEALKLGLVDEIVNKDVLDKRAMEAAEDYSVKDADAFRAIKKLLRKPVADGYRKREIESVYEFADIWYSRKTREKIKKITIR